MAERADHAQARDLLLAAMVAEHELYRAAAEACAAAERWEARALLAERKEEFDLAVAARQRAATQWACAREYATEYAQQRAHVAELKQLLAGRPSVPTRRRAPPGWGNIEVKTGAGQAVPAGSWQDPDAILEAQLADLKERLGRA